MNELRSLEGLVDLLQGGHHHSRGDSQLSVGTHSRNRSYDGLSQMMSPYTRTPHGSTSLSKMGHVSNGYEQQQQQQQTHALSQSHLSPVQKEESIENNNNNTFDKKQNHFKNYSESSVFNNDNNNNNNSKNNNNLNDNNTNTNTNAITNNTTDLGQIPNYVPTITRATSMSIHFNPISNESQQAKERARNKQRQIMNSDKQLNLYRAISTKSIDPTKLAQKGGTSYQFPIEKKYQTNETRNNNNDNNNNNKNDFFPSLKKKHSTESAHSESSNMSLSNVSSSSSSSGASSCTHSASEQSVSLSRDEKTLTKSNSKRKMSPLADDNENEPPTQYPRRRLDGSSDYNNGGGGGSVATGIHLPLSSTLLTPQVNRCILSPTDELSEVAGCNVSPNRKNNAFKYHHHPTIHHTLEATKEANESSNEDQSCSDKSNKSNKSNKSGNKKSDKKSFIENNENNKNNNKNQNKNDKKFEKQKRKEKEKEKERENKNEIEKENEKDKSKRSNILGRLFGKHRKSSSKLNKKDKENNNNNNNKNTNTMINKETKARSQINKENRVDKSAAIRKNDNPITNRNATANGNGNKSMTASNSNAGLPQLQMHSSFDSIDENNNVVHVDNNNNDNNNDKNNTSNNSAFLMESFDDSPMIAPLHNNNDNIDNDNNMNAGYTMELDSSVENNRHDGDIIIAESSDDDDEDVNNATKPIASNNNGLGLDLGLESGSGFGLGFEYNSENDKNETDSNIEDAEMTEGVKGSILVPKSKTWKTRNDNNNNNNVGYPSDYNSSDYDFDEEPSYQDLLDQHLGKDMPSIGLEIGEKKTKKDKKNKNQNKKNKKHKKKKKEKHKKKDTNENDSDNESQGDITDASDISLNDNNNNNNNASGFGLGFDIAESDDNDNDSDANSSANYGSAAMTPVMDDNTGFGIGFDITQTYIASDSDYDNDDDDNNKDDKKNDKKNRKTANDKEDKMGMNLDITRNDNNRDGNINFDVGLPELSLSSIHDGNNNNNNNNSNNSNVKNDNSNSFGLNFEESRENSIDKDVQNAIEFGLTSLNAKAQEYIESQRKKRREMFNVTDDKNSDNNNSKTKYKTKHDRPQSTRTQTRGSTKHLIIPNDDNDFTSNSNSNNNGHDNDMNDRYSNRNNRDKSKGKKKRKRSKSKERNSSKKSSNRSKKSKNDEKTQNSSSSKKKAKKNKKDKSSSSLKEEDGDDNNDTIFPVFPSYEYKLFPSHSSPCSEHHIDSKGSTQNHSRHSSTSLQESSMLGQGAFGFVQKAFHFKSCQTVAIKVCRTKKQNELNAFSREAQLYLYFNGKSDYIVQCLGFGIDNQHRLCMALEYMNLKSVSSYMQSISQSTRNNNNTMNNMSNTPQKSATVDSTLLTMNLTPMAGLAPSGVGLTSNSDVILSPATTNASNSTRSSTSTLLNSQRELNEEEERMRNSFTMSNQARNTVDVLGSLAKSRINGLSENRAKYIAKCTLMALDVLHKENYVHNDVKPDNILMNARGDVKLGDFGCVKKIPSTTAAYLTRVIGSVRYYAPEKWLQYPVQYGTKSDIWSFGITMFEILTGHIETTTANANTTEDSMGLSSPGAGYIEAPKLHRHKFSFEACDFIDKCLNKDANKRWSANDLLKHAWIADADKVSYCDNINDDDLKFIVESLIEYYSQRHFLDPAISRGGTLRQQSNERINNNNNKNNNDNNDSKKTTKKTKNGLDNDVLHAKIAAIESYHRQQSGDINMNNNDSKDIKHDKTRNSKSVSTSDSGTATTIDFNNIEARIRGNSQATGPDTGNNSRHSRELSQINNNAHVMKRMSSHGVARPDTSQWEDMLDNSARSSTSIGSNQNDNNNNNPASMSSYLLMDGTKYGFTDEERIENIARHTGCTPKQVTKTIKYYVANLRSKLAARASMSSSQFMSQSPAKKKGYFGDV